MATKESERVAEHRKKNFDRISLLLEKGGRQLVKVLALREDCTSAELCRRAILSRAGLRIFPFPDQIEQLDGVETQKQAQAAIMRLQGSEMASETVQHIIDNLSAEPSTGQFVAILSESDIADLSFAMKQIQAAIKAAQQNTKKETVTVGLSGRSVGVLRRFMANLVDKEKSLTKY